MIKIWGRSTSLNVQKVLWCCVELGIAFHRIDWAGPFGGNDDPAYLKMNPNGRVPTIEDGDKIVWESNSILRYLCAVHGGARLHPAEPYRRSEVERWMDWQLASLNPPMTTMLLGYYRTPPDKRDAGALEAARREALRCWTIVERFIAGRQYLAGPGAHFGGYRQRHPGAPLAQLSDRAARASQHQGLVSDALPAAGLPPAHHGPDRVTSL